MVAKNLGGCLIAEALTWRIIIDLDQVRKVFIGERRHGMEGVMRGEFGAVIEGHGLAPGWGQRGQQRGEQVGAGRGGLPGGPRGEEQAGMACVQCQDGLAIEPEHHQIGFPMAGGLAVDLTAVFKGAMRIRVSHGNTLAKVLHFVCEFRESRVVSFSLPTEKQRHWMPPPRLSPSRDEGVH